MASERSRMQRLLNGVREVKTASGRVCRLGRIGPNEAVLSETGIGKVNAAVGAVEMIREWRPDCLISTGVAGGIDASLEVMDVVAGAEVVYHDVDCGPGNEPGQVQGLPPSYFGDPRLLECAKSVHAEAKVAAGLICSGDQFVESREQSEAIKARHPAGLAVDMESGALAQVCHIYGVPFLSFRILSDTPGPKSRFKQYEDFWGVMADRSFAVAEAFLRALPARL